VKEAWMSALWKRVSKEILKYLRENHTDLREVAKSNIDLVPLIKKHYMGMARDIVRDIRRMGIEVTREDLKHVTAYIIYFLRQNGYECDGDVVKWIYVNVKNLAKEFLGVT